MTVEEAREKLPEETKRMSDVEVEKLVVQLEELADVFMDLADDEIKKIGIKAFRKKYKVVANAKK